MLVAQIRHVQRQLRAPQGRRQPQQIDVQRQVRQQVGRHVDTVGGVGLGGARVAQAQADAQSRQRALHQFVLAPYAGHGLRHADGTLAHFIDVIAFTHFQAVPRDVGCHVEIAREIGQGIEFHAMRLDFARLQAVQRIVRIQGLHVFLAQVKHGGREKSVETGRLVFHAHFRLLALGGVVGFAVEIVAQHGVERGHQADVRCQAILGQIDGARLPRQRIILLRRRRDAVQAVARGRVRPILAHARAEHPLPRQLDLLLRVQTVLVRALHGARIALGRGQHMAQVDGLVHIDLGAGRTAIEHIIFFRVAVIEPHQGLEFGAAAAPTGLGIVIQRPALAIDIEEIGRAAQGALVGQQAALNGFRDQVDPAVAGLGMDAPHVIDTVLQQIGERILHAVIVQALFVEHLVVGKAAMAVRQQGTLDGRHHGRRTELVARVVGQQGQAGGRAGAPAKGGRDIHLVVRHAGELGIAIAQQARHAVSPVAALAHGATHIALHLLAVEVARLQLQFAVGLKQRLFADLVDDAARRILAIQHGTGSPQHFHRFQAIRLDLGPGLHRGAAQAVAQHAVAAHVEAADLDVIETIIALRSGHRRTGQHAGRIPQRLADGLDALRIHLVARDDGNGSGRFDQRRIGLARRRALRGDFQALRFDRHALHGLRRIRRFGGIGGAASQDQHERKGNGAHKARQTVGLRA